MAKIIKIALGIAFLIFLGWLAVAVIKLAILLLPLVIIVLGGWILWRYLKAKGVT